MKKISLSVLIAPIAFAAVPALAVPVVDVVEAPTGFFAPGEAETFDSPYYRNADQDWGWTHGPIAAGFTSASLLISAFDVDFESTSFPPGERDEIFVRNDGVLESLGFLVGENDTYAFTEFTLGADLFDDIAAGLEVFMDIDTGNDGWLVTLGKSVITTDGASPPPPTPGEVPVPAALPLLASGFALMSGLGFARRRRKA
ncbi:hypothetical protein Ga0609869_000187 [Rhodovulum iodosum]|uniref:VPLPA-CTERM sorting domain-containing protein n=1 Tax=Rhodovulum iodosum TaxID=68291 RepID=A0ABV3XNP8_9RHOB|nr:hypothetical protein [Rhodovulum robiginosum]RSK34738.1 hypothetical protein EJA01_07205 [Rhodovulum robiginosum]